MSFCPDDIDNDLIIDNIDVDLDNDGILNCDESKGNTSIDFTDPNSPILNFIDGSSDSSFISSTLTKVGTSTFSGDGSSNFNSTVSSGAGSELEYILNFNEASNIELTQNTSTTHSNVTGEIFILKIGPNTKNITLIDTDNILLVDTDFDDVFETGVTNFSSAEIRFKFNPTPSGSTPYKLVANSINQLIFKHLLNNTVNNSTFEGNLILTCFGIDSDQDGVVDAFDADSDNDGIPDIIEAQGIPVILSGIDADLDGLDDIFTTPITPIDSDGDNVFDYLDLDSDNDGVYDLWEAGHPLEDVILKDGQIDNVSVGVNGLDDRLETASDSFILNYIVSDPDTDGIFSYLDFDSDGDECPDVIEAGFLDPNNDNIIGPLPVVVDDKGI